MNNPNNDGAIDDLPDAHEVIGASTAKNSNGALNRFNEYLERAGQSYEMYRDLNVDNVTEAFLLQHGNECFGRFATWLKGHYGKASSAKQAFSYVKCHFEKLYPSLTAVGKCCSERQNEELQKSIKTFFAQQSRDERKPLVDHKIPVKERDNLELCKWYFLTGDHKMRSMQSMDWIAIGRINELGSMEWRDLSQHSPQVWQEEHADYLNCMKLDWYRGKTHNLTAIHGMMHAKHYFSCPMHSLICMLVMKKWTSSNLFPTTRGEVTRSYEKTMNKAMKDAYDGMRADLEEDMIGFRREDDDNDSQPDGGRESARWHPTRELTTHGNRAGGLGQMKLYRIPRDWRDARAGLDIDGTIKTSNAYESIEWESDSQCARALAGWPDLNSGGVVPLWKKCMPQEDRDLYRSLRTKIFTPIAPQFAGKDEEIKGIRDVLLVVLLRWHNTVVEDSRTINTCESIKIEVERMAGDCGILPAKLSQWSEGILEEYTRVNVTGIPLVDVGGSLLQGIESINRRLIRLENSSTITNGIILEVRGAVHDLIANANPNLNPRELQQPNQAGGVRRVGQQPLGFNVLPQVRQVRRQQVPLEANAAAMQEWTIAECFCNWYFQRLYAVNVSTLNQKDRDRYTTLSKLISYCKYTFDEGTTIEAEPQGQDGTQWLQHMRELGALAQRKLQEKTQQEGGGGRTTVPKFWGSFKTLQKMSREDFSPFPQITDRTIGAHTSNMSFMQPVHEYIIRRKRLIGGEEVQGEGGGEGGEGGEGGN